MLREVVVAVMVVVEAEVVRVGEEGGGSWSLRCASISVGPLLLSSLSRRTTRRLRACMAATPWLTCSAKSASGLSWPCSSAATL